MSRARDLADLGGSADAGGLTGRNLIINGGMSVAQRGTSSTSSGMNSVDRWSAAFGGSGAAVTQSQESLSSSDAPYALGLRNYFRSTVTGTSTDTGAYHQIFQYIEAQNVAQSGWNLNSTSSFITLSFWVRSSLAGTYTVFLRSMDGTSQAYAHEFTLSADTWTKVTKTIPGASNITINNDNGQGLLVDILPYYGTDYTTSSSTTDAWKAFDGTDLTKDYAQNWLNTSSATFDITGVQLEVGSTATPFEHEEISVTILKCFRYYEAATSGNTVGYVGNVTSGVNYHIAYKHAVEMNRTPDYTYTAVATAHFGTSVTFQISGVNGTNLYQAATSTQNGAYYLGYITADAEL